MVVIDCERRELSAEDSGNDVERLKRDFLARRFLFVDNVRFLAMLGILSLHSMNVVVEALRLGPTMFAYGIEDALKFGTIAFFLISGFLLGDQFHTATRRQYLRRRLKKVFVPWLFWFYLMVACRVAHDIHRHRLQLSLDWTTVHAVGEIVNGFALGSNLWFVPNLFLCVTVLLIFRKHLLSLWLGAALLAANLFYLSNIYIGWMQSGHTRALFGFVFYLWLGAYAAHHYSTLLHAFARIPTTAMVAVAVATGASSLWETSHLVRLPGADPVNTLRVSNQLFSVAIVLVISRFNMATWPKFVDVRRQMFGVYLTQVMVLGRLENGLGWGMARIPGSEIVRGRVGLLTLWLATTVVGFLVCITMSQWLAKHRYLGWMVGDHSMHNAERRAVAMIEERAAALEANAALERVAASRRGKGSEQEMGDVTLA